jgi:hypothetical protein
MFFDFGLSVLMTGDFGKANFHRRCRFATGVLRSGCRYVTFLRKYTFIVQYFVGLLCLPALLAAGSEDRVFKSDDRVELEAEVVLCVAGESVSVRRRDRRLFKDVP